MQPLHVQMSPNLFSSAFQEIKLQELMYKCYLGGFLSFNISTFEPAL